MNTKTIILALVASSVLATPVLAQEKTEKNVEQTAQHTSGHRDRGPIDLEKFTRMEELKAADTNKDGILSREEIEAHAQKMMVKRAADRMERRLDVNGDGKISLEAIEKHRTARFAELDKNKDGKLDRSELKQGKRHGKGKYHDNGGRHGQNDEQHQNSDAE